MSRDNKFVLFLKRTHCTENPLCSQFSLYSLQWLYWGEGRGCSKFLNEWPQASRECCIFHQTGILDKTIRSYYSSSLFGSFPTTTEKMASLQCSKDGATIKLVGTSTYCTVYSIIAKIPCHFFPPIVFLTFNARKRLYFISVSSCVSIA